MKESARVQDFFSKEGYTGRMKKFIAVFVAPIESYDKMKEEMKKKTPEERQKEMVAWGEWMKRHEKIIIDRGAPVGSAKRVSEGGKITDVRNEIGGFMIIGAETAEEAASIFKDSPHFGVSGGGVEVMEMLSM